MKTQLTQTYLMLIIIISLAACSKTTPTTTIGTGTITGTVQLWNDKTTSLTDRSGVTVTLENINGQTATTDANGNYGFSNVPYDRYNISFSKAGYGTLRYLGVDHEAPVSPATGTIVPSVTFGAVSTTSIITLNASGNIFNGGPGISYTYTMSPVPSSSNRGYVRAFLSTSSTVSNQNYVAYAAVKSASNNNVTGGFTNDELYAMGFTSGQTVYVKVYGDSFISNDYTDPLTGKRIFPNLNVNAAAPVSFVIP